MDRSRIEDLPDDDMSDDRRRSRTEELRLAAAAPAGMVIMLYELGTKGVGKRRKREPNDLGEKI